MSLLTFAEAKYLKSWGDNHVTQKVAIRTDCFTHGHQVCIHIRDFGFGSFAKAAKFLQEDQAFETLASEYPQMFKVRP
jgi:hypothetical protein